MSVTDDGQTRVEIIDFSVVPPVDPSEFALVNERANEPGVTGIVPASVAQPGIGTPISLLPLDGARQVTFQGRIINVSS